MSVNMSASVAIFWDYENCALPALEPSYTIVNKIRRLAHQYGSVKSFKAYLEYPEQMSVKSVNLRSELQSCGVSLIDCPHNGRKDVADKMMMIDMMAHAIDTPAPSTIILISGDRDFVYAVSVLGLRQYRVVLLAPRAAHGSLKVQASAVYNWPDDFLPELPPSLDTAVVKPRRLATLDDFWNKRSSYPTPPSTSSTSASSESHVPSDATSKTVEGESDIHPLQSDSPGLQHKVNDPNWDNSPSPTMEKVVASGSIDQGRTLNASAAPFVLNATIPAKYTDAVNDPNDSGWETYSRAAKKRPVQLPSEFKPLVKVLKRQLVEGVVQVESSQLGQFLSQEVPRLSIIYERAGVTRLKEYTALAAEQGIITMTREGADGHNYIALHPMHRRKAATTIV
ncbi:NYN domain-containing protein [Cerioporus squamosus]|nr:NYN domain-containing protein [Cerioporus squamosus]